MIFYIEVPPLWFIIFTWSRYKKFSLLEFGVVSWPAPWSSMRETNACPLAIMSAFLAGLVENFPGQVEFCIKHIKNISFRCTYPRNLVSHTGAVTWHNRSWLSLVQVMACCFLTPRHYPHHCWLSSIGPIFIKKIICNYNRNFFNQENHCEDVTYNCFPNIKSFITS